MQLKKETQAECHITDSLAKSGWTNSLQLFQSVIFISSKETPTASENFKCKSLYTSEQHKKQANLM